MQRSDSRSLPLAANRYRNSSSRLFLRPRPTVRQFDTFWALPDVMRIIAPIRYVFLHVILNIAPGEAPKDADILRAGTMNKMIHIRMNPTSLAFVVSVDNNVGIPRGTRDTM
jgi:hypothetical protein